MATKTVNAAAAGKYTAMRLKLRKGLKNIKNAMMYTADYGIKAGVFCSLL